ncbi:hypothetical protein J7T55_013840 [Diaporthe amygdali]|uniref:uncharacterized protein n=1 Tax=Phomopsis amygdali TaxID=1214568 RepID=UPI0022FE52E0|nr:uncharacterized protein J7T55_013840 [Diaporthe amygdali]KAJ0119637.1 hypothetical protein J7T55_013840 [Diaporthe amygdali]
MVSFFGLGKKKKEAQDEGPVHSLYAQQWKREQSPFGPRVPQTNSSSTSLPARPSSSHSSKGPSGQNSIYANKSATGSMQDLSTRRPGSTKPPRTGSPLRPTSADGKPTPNLGNARPMSPSSLAAAASQAGFRFENSPQKPHGAQSPRNSNQSTSKTPGDSPAKRPSPGSIERNRSPLGRYEVRSEADSEVSSPMSQSQTTRSNVTSLTSVGSDMDKQIGQWAVRVSASSGIDEKVSSPTASSQYDLDQDEKEAALDDSEENGLKALDTISISEPRQSLMPQPAHTGDGRGYSMILQYYLDSDARESMVI